MSSDLLKNKLSSFWFILLLFHTQTALCEYIIPSRISYPLVINSSNPNVLYLPVTLDKISITMPIDVSSDLIWIKKASDDSSTFKDFNYFVSEPCKIEGEEKEGVIKLGNVNFENMPFLEVPSAVPSRLKSTLGLAKKFGDKKFSILSGFRKRGIEEEFSIELQVDEDYTESYFLIIGNHNEETSYNSKKIIDCDLVDIGTKWACNLNGIVIGDLKEEEKSENGKVYYLEAKSKNYRKIDEPFVFETIQKYFIMPKSYVEFFKKKIFNALGNSCKFIEDKERNLNGFFCKSSALENFPKVNFIINNYVLTLEKEQLFEEVGEDQFLFTIVQSDLITRWTFGNLIIKKYKIIFDSSFGKLRFLNFHQETEKIRIIGDYHPAEDTNFSEVTSYEISFGIILCSSIIGIVLLLISLFKQKVFIETIN